MLERSWARYAVLRLSLDIVFTELSLLAAGRVLPLLQRIGRAPGQMSSPARLDPAVYVLVGLIWAAISLLLSLYEASEQRAVDEAQAVFAATSLATLLLSSALYFLYPRSSRPLIVTFYAIDLVVLLGLRVVLRGSLRWAGLPRYGERSVLIVGAGEGGRDVCRMVRSHGWAGLRPVGFLDDSLPVGTEAEGLPVLGRIDQVTQVVADRRVDEVVIALPLEAYDRFLRLTGTLVALPARVRIVPDHIKHTLFRTRVAEFAGVPMITMQKPALSPFERSVKRAFDLVVGSISLVLSLPLALLIAIAIRLDSPGPVIFMQERVGENGRPFRMFKFRSMVKDAESQQAELLDRQEHGLINCKQPDDPRVTRVGKIIRRTSLDELPQLINVIKGDMSLVGPRPELPYLVARYEPWQRQRLAVPQGLTGWWQVNGRSDKPMYLHTEDDLYYVQNYSLLLDLQILWRTVAAVLKREGAF